MNQREALRRLRHCDWADKPVVHLPNCTVLGLCLLGCLAFWRLVAWGIWG